ncbi:MAG: ABC transporter ATP-binding protein [Thermoanaerobaculaceae bacterium]|nr:ABC transporter ATP-binding protein [Thermoanaerobaculaceae bacterium]TAM49015.1 MAG: ABC transporter ATP-binding protein [Acidobacteriota bacterium]
MERETAPTATDTPPSVEIRGLAKRYLLFGRRRDRALALLGRTGGLRSVTALEGIDLEVRPGEAVGVVGENGSGKSTLLRLVAGISTPDAGTIRVAQPVAPILELGLGFHPEFTGRENALLYGSLLGIPAPAMAERLDDVLAFAELGEFVDRPLRTYSSGMAARLAFAVATNVDPRVLVVDEALAVGDGAFQKKCVDRMVRFKEEGRTVLFCSHAMYLVTSFCERAVWLHQGRIRNEGPSQGVVEEYESYLMQREKRRLAGVAETPWRPAVVGGRRGRIADVRVLGLDGSPAERMGPGEGFEVVLAVESLDRSSAFHVAVAIDSQDGRCIFAATTHFDGVAPLAGATEYEVRLRIPALPLASGTFAVSGFLFDENGLHTYDQVVAPAALRVERARWTPSLLELDHEWIVSG